MRNAVFMLCLIVLAGCERAASLEVEPDPNGNATLSRIQTRIFDTNCALSGCHAGANPQQGMDLSAGQAFSNIVNVPSREVPALMRVAPGDPENSYLLQKVRGDAGIVGARMPLGRAPLSAEDIELIRKWIEGGAQDD